MRRIPFMLLAIFMAISTFAQDLYETDLNSNLVFSQKDPLPGKPGIAVYAELGGKGFFSVNADFPITLNHRFSFGLTQLDYDIEEYENFQVGPGGALTGSLMYYYLVGKEKSFFELGTGFSLYHRLGVDYYNDSPLTIHGVIGYRYQKKDGLLFRAGFTPFIRVNSLFLPLIGISLGYSW